jgi:hypothetical protein
MASFEPIDFGPFAAPAPQGPLRITVRPKGVALPAMLSEEGEAAPRLPVLDPRSRDLVVRTVLGAAGTEPDDRQAAVAAVIRNRLESGRFGDNVRRVAVAPAQFDAWGTPAGRARMFGYASDGPDYLRAAANVDRAFGTERYDPTDGAMHFEAPAATNARVTAAVGENNVELPGAGSRFADSPGQSFRTAREGVSPTVGTKDEAAFEGLANSATFNFRDELKGLLAAGGFDFDKKDSSADIAMAKGAYRLMTGDPTAVAAYRVAVNEAREKSQRLKEQQPGASIAGELAGGLVTLPLGAGGAVARGLTLGQRAIQGAKAGAIFGTASGLGEGTDSASRATHALAAASLGGVVGGLAAPVAHKVIGFASQWVKSGRTVQSMVRPDGTLTDEAAAAARASGVDPATISAVIRQGPGRSHEVVRGRASARPREPAAESGGRWSGLYPPPRKPPRPFESDYPQGAPVDASGRLRYDMDGRPLYAKYVVGRRTAGGADETIERSELNDIGLTLMGSLPREVHPYKLGNADGVYRKTRDGRPVDIRIARDLWPWDKEQVLGHEIGHLLDHVSAHRISMGGIHGDFLRNYRTLNTGSEGGALFTPADRGYPPSEMRLELVAEAIRAYLANPNYLKTVAPELAATIREAVNAHPTLSKLIQFNSLGAATFGLTRPGDDSDATRAPNDGSRT